MGICSCLRGRGAIQNSNTCFAYSWPHVNVHEIGWNWSEESGLDCIVTWETLSEGVSKSLSHSHDPSGKLFILDSRSLNCFSVLQKSCPACQRTHRQLRFTQQHHQVDIGSNNQVCWKQNRTKDNVIFTDVNEKMINTARCLQLSMQIHTTYIALLFSKKSNAVTCQRWNVHLILFLNTSVVSGGERNSSQGFHYLNHLTAMN